MGAISGTKGRFLGLAATALTPLATLVPGLAPAQVVTDGSTGPGVTLIGPHYQITDDLGTRAGDNLFHSFSEFSISTGRSATFSGPDEIENVISRVTGPNPSDIDGTLRSTMPAADFYFINPNGVTFGPNARLDVQGSFHVSTADELRFEGGDVFSATNPDSSSFAVAEPRAFGFFDAEPGNIIVDRSELQVTNGALSLIGGNIDIIGGVDSKFAGVVAGTTLAQLVATSGIGEVSIETGNTNSQALGNISIHPLGAAQTLDGGVVRIRANRLSLNNGQLLNVTVSKMASTGVIDVEAKIIEMSNKSLIAGDAKCIFAPDCDPGTGASILIRSEELHLHNESIIASAAFEDSDAGSIDIVTDVLKLSDDNGVAPSRILTSSQNTSSGDAGQIKIVANKIYLGRGTDITSEAYGEGSAGSIFISGGDIEIHEARIATTSFSNTNAGSVLIIASDVLIENSGSILSQARGEGEGGRIDVDAKRTIIMADGSTISSGSLFGDGGDVNVIADIYADLSKGSQIGASAAAGTGTAGRIDVAAPILILSDSEIQADADAGFGGEVAVKSPAMIRSPSSILSARAGPAGIDGTVVTSSPEVDLTGGLLVLDSQFADTSRLLRDSCESGGDLGGSTFVESGQLPAMTSGGGLLPGFYSGALVTGQKSEAAGESVVQLCP